MEKNKRITKADMQELVCDATPVDRLKEIYALYVEKRRNGVYGGGKVRIFKLLAPEIVNKLLRGHVAFLQEYGAFAAENQEMKLDAVLDRLMDKRLQNAFEEAYRDLGWKWELLLKPEADDGQLIELLEKYMMTQWNGTRLYDEMVKKQPFFLDMLLANVIVKRREILENVKAKKADGVEKFLYLVDKELFENYFEDSSLKRLWDPNEKVQVRRSQIAKYVDIRKDEPHEFHRMQLISYLHEGIISRMEKAVDARLGTVTTGTFEEKCAARKLLREIFEQAFDEAYRGEGDALEEFFFGGNEGEKGERNRDILYRMVMKTVSLETVKQGGVLNDDGTERTRKMSLDELYARMNEKQRDKVNFIFSELGSRYSFSENREKFEANMIKYGYDPKKQSELLEQALYRLSLAKRDAVSSYKKEQIRDQSGAELLGNGKSVVFKSVDALEASTKGIQKNGPTKGAQGRKKLSGRGSVSSTRAEMEQRLFEISAMYNARILIKELLDNNRPKAHAIMQTIFYLWIYPYQNGKEIDAIVEGYNPGAKRPGYPAQIEAAYGTEAMAIMRHDLRDGLDDLMGEDVLKAIDQAPFALREYACLDGKMDLFEYAKQLNVLEEEKAKKKKEIHEVKTRSYQLETEDEMAVKIRDEALYDHMLREFMKDKDAISKCISTRKRSIDWDQHVKDILKTIAKLRQEGI